MSAQRDLDRRIAEAVYGLVPYTEAEECSQFTPGAYWCSGDTGYHAVDLHYALPPVLAGEWQAATTTDDEIDRWLLRRYSSNTHDCKALIADLTNAGITVTRSYGYAQRDPTQQFQGCRIQWTPDYATTAQAATYTEAVMAAIVAYLDQPRRITDHVLPLGRWEVDLWVWRHQTDPYGPAPKLHGTDSI